MMISKTGLKISVQQEDEQASMETAGLSESRDFSLPPEPLSRRTVTYKSISQMSKEERLKLGSKLIERKEWLVERRNYIIAEMRSAGVERSRWWLRAAASSIDISGCIGCLMALPFERTLDLITTFDFYGSGTSDVLWFNNATGDTGFWSLGSNGAVTGWHDLGTAGSGYSVAAIGDYLGNNTSDVLFKSTATGDVGFWSISSGAVTGWHDLGIAGAGYGVHS